MSIDKFFFKFEGKDVKEKAIPIDYFSALLRSFQNYFRKIVNINNPNVRKKWTRLVLTDIEAGSSLTTIELKEPKLLMPETFDASKELALDILKIIQIESEDLAYQKLKEKIKKTIDRIDLYSSLTYLWSTKTISTSVGSSSIYDGEKLVILKHQYKFRIKKWSKKEQFEQMKEFKGFLIRIKTDAPAYLTIQDENGEMVKMDFELGDLSKFKELLTKLVKIRGDVEVKGHQKIIKKLFDIQKIEEIQVQKLPKYTLKRPLIFKVISYEDGVLLTEEFIPLNLDLDILSDLETELQDYLEFLVETYVKNEPSQLTDKALQLREKLIELLNL